MGDATMSFGLPGGGEWLLVHLAPPYEAREAVLAVELGSGSWLSIGLETRSELERSVAEGSPAGMGWWLDAIAASAAVRETEG